MATGLLAMKENFHGLSYPAANLVSYRVHCQGAGYSPTPSKIPRNFMDNLLIEWKSGKNPPYVKMFD